MLLWQATFIDSINSPSMARRGVANALIYSIYLDISLLLGSLAGDGQFLGLGGLLDAVGRDDGAIDVDATRHAAA